ncbi:hypothetical protein [Paracidovorax valerianellae]|uniref:DUF1579 domain-containing protein n=1 Tax=Paracidovorax valerianellae TaxID=187868 RepID=A0A1G6PSF6_9BURK|nr:hypothetical protein [Paracidovorax valerianellae]MDA8444966.1 hypothetical protein [Paracidovorax valerianellae]SDC82958.1 hypothetical protein SAMN05192589_103326 [Paracidovorax valerianellae]
MNLPDTIPPTGDASDFDFLMGPWHIRNTRLVRRLAGCTEWETFDATGTARPLPGGIANCDDFIPATWCAGYVGMALRLFNPQNKRWTIYWLDNVTGGLDPATDMLWSPVVGGFSGTDRGLFFGQDMFEGRPVQVRFYWTKNLATGTPRWEQAFSDDEGRSWETNWVMEFSRPGG